MILLQKVKTAMTNIILYQNKESNTYIVLEQWASYNIELINLITTKLVSLHQTVQTKPKSISWSRMWRLFDYFQIRVPSFCKYKHFLRLCKIVCFRVRILKSALLPHANTQSSDVIAYLLADCTISWMSLCTGLTLYNQVKYLTTCEWQLTEVVECFKLYFDFQANTGRI